MAKRREQTKGIFEKVTYAIKGIEASVVEFLATVGPWLAPLTPASMTYYHVVDTLGFQPIWGWTTAISVEILGLASGHTWAKFHQHNKEFRAKKDKLPVLPVVLTFGFYLLVVTVINMALDWTMASAPERLAKLGLILLSVPAIVIVSIRAQHAKVLLAKESYVPKPRTHVPAAVVVTGGNGTRNVMNDLREFLAENNLTAHDVCVGGAVTPKEAARILQANPRTVRTGLHRLRKQGD